MMRPFPSASLIARSSATQHWNLPYVKSFAAASGLLRSLVNNYSAEPSRHARKSCSHVGAIRLPPRPSVDYEPGCPGVLRNGFVQMHRDRVVQGVRYRRLDVDPWKALLQGG